ncbi:MAG: hypothetical protein R2828_32615 [Saprospiraceae bacterium]
MLALPMLNPDGIGNGLGFAWSVAAFRPRLTTSHLYAGSTNIESRWDWKWLGVCLVCCCFPPSTYDLRLFDLRLRAGSTNIESRWDWKWLGVCLVCCCFPPSTFDLRLSDFRLHAGSTNL